jgi:hypothetical protein
LRGISTTWSLSPLQWWSQKKHRSKGGESNTHKTQIRSTTTHTSHDLSSKHNARSSQLKWSSNHYHKESNAWSWSLRMLSECLGCSSMRLGVPFIAPRQLGAVGDKLGRPSLPSVEWRTGQSSAPPDRSCRRSGARPPSKNGISDRCSTGLIGAVRCTSWPLEQSMCRAKIARPTVGAGVRWLTGQSGAPPDSPVNYSHVAPLLFPRAPSSSRMTHRTVRCTTEQSGEL